MNAAPAVTSDDVRDALRKRWPDAEYLTIDEVAQSSDRQGRRIDLLVLSHWRSRGLTLDAVEIKVSLRDAMRELNEPAKADWWWRHTDRFWLAVPHSLAARITGDGLLPPTWGLLSILDDGTARVAVGAPKHDREEFDWASLVGIMRAAANAGSNALYRAEERGYRRGLEAAEAHAESGSDRAALERLQEQVRAAEEATGVSINAWASSFGRVERPVVYDAVRRVLADEQEIERARAQLVDVERRLVRTTAAVRKHMNGDG